MNRFALHNLPASRLRVVSMETSTPAQDWDTISAVVEGAMSEDAMRQLYPTGARYNKGLGFFLQEPRFEPGGAFFTRAELTLRGLFGRKVWARPGVALATRSMSNLTIRIGNTNVTYPKASVLDATPTFRAFIFDGLAPPYSSVGKAASAPPPGLAWPVNSTASPWSFWGDYEPTYNVPSGWVLTDIQSDVVEGPSAAIASAANQLYGKEQVYTLYWPKIP